MAAAAVPEPQTKKPQHRIAGGSVVVAPDGSATGECLVCGAGVRLLWNKVERLAAGGFWKCRTIHRARGNARSWSEHPDHPGWLYKQVMTLWSSFRLTPVDWGRMLELQGHRCAVAGCEREPTCLDHDHSMNARDPDSHRGILCGACNTGLGAFRDSPALLCAAARYIERRHLITHPLAA